ncbi:hypothetical protein [Halorubrum sp. SS7]|uniref:hypothetical protein n=1 Tax=Halorubrum sp. SS7 TaxID=2518119 RepID=UPI0018EE6477|nr:hypothetical protein [Halorubrum sp. SS7]
MYSSFEAERYHVVCRECPLERLCDAPTDAEVLGQGHVADTGHRVAVERIA